MPKRKYPLQPGETRIDAERRVEGERRLAILSFIVEFSGKGDTPQASGT